MPRPTQHTSHLHIEVTPRLHDKLKRAARRRGVSVSHVIRDMVEANLDVYGRHVAPDYS